MQFTVLTEDLAKALDVVIKGANVGRTPVDLFKCVHITIKDNKATLAGFNGSVYVTAVIPVTNAEDGIVCVTAQTLRDYIGRCDRDTEVNFASTESILNVTCGKLKFSLGITNPDGFPEKTVVGDEGTKVVLNSDIFKDLLSRVLFCCSRANDRPALAGINLICTNGTLQATTVDGFRLARATLNVNGVADFKALLSGSILENVLRYLAGDVTITIEGKNAEVAFVNGEAQISIVMPTIEAPFPDTSKILDNPAETIDVIANVEELTSAVGIAELTASSGQDKTYLRVGNNGDTLTIDVKTSVATSSQELDITREGAVDKKIDVLLRPKYVSDICRVLTTDEVKMKVIDGLNLVRFEPIGGDMTIVYGVLPIRP